MTKAELMKHARVLGIKVASKATKGEITALLLIERERLHKLVNAGLSGNARQRRVERRRREAEDR